MNMNFMSNTSLNLNQLNEKWVYEQYPALAEAISDICH